jgi:energy-coupling factor transport system permease protein
MVVAGALLCVAGLSLAGRRVERTVYRPDPWRWPEAVVVATGLVVGYAGWWLGHHQVSIAYPDPGTTPQVSLLALAAALVGLVPAVAAPAPRVAVA